MHRQLELERQNQQIELLKQITSILELEFVKPAAWQLGTYNADESTFAVTVSTDDQTYQEAVHIPRDEARVLKEHSSEAEAQAVFGVGLDDGKPVDFFFEVRVRFHGKQYTSLPPNDPPDRDDLIRYYQVYQDPYVLYLRRVLNAYVKGVSAAEETSAFDHFDPAYFRSRFMVGSINKNIFGGKDLIIVFQDYPYSLFYAWIYKGEAYKLRLFRVEKATPAVLKRMRIQFRQALQDQVHLM